VHYCACVQAPDPVDEYAGDNLKRGNAMKLVIIPPYRGMNWKPAVGHYMLNPLVDRMKKDRQLEGVEIVIDEGHPSDEASESRDEAVYAGITAGFLKRVKLYSQGNDCDAIISSGGNDVGFYGARIGSKIPVVYSLHSAVHAASLIGDRFSIIACAYAAALTGRRATENYGLGHKLATARYTPYSTTRIAAFVRKKLDGQIEAPDVQKFLDDMTGQCMLAIEEDRVDSLLFINPGLQCFDDEIKQRLDAAGFGEIQTICGLAAAVEMAKALVGLKLIQSPRAYPHDSLKAKAKYC
jgi:Asp/Glu/hydantoin racemase